MGKKDHNFSKYHNISQFDSYEDIIHLPHHVSQTRIPMSLHDRAAQFAPFAALTGYGEAITETDRDTKARIELTESERNKLDEIIKRLLYHPENNHMVDITYFVPDERKEGGSYQTIRGQLKKADPYLKRLQLTDGRSIPLSEISDIQEV